MPRKQRVRFITGKRPNLFQANFGGIIADPHRKSRSRKGGGQSLGGQSRKNNRRIYHAIRRTLVSAGYSTHFNPDPDHDCYEKKMPEGTTFFLHLPNGRVTAYKPANKWILTIYVATEDDMRTRHSKLKEKFTFVPDFINSDDPQGFIRRLERRLISRLDSSDSTTA